MSAEAEEQERVLEETRRMIEEDCDLEIEQVRKMYEGRLQHEKENLLKLKGDNGLIKKKNAQLKKKNQELEKFKFVLDYKIKELRKQIEPKDLEINGMKETIKEMDAELERYNKTNQVFELDNQSLQLKLDALHKELMKQRSTLADSEALNRRFRTDLEETVQYIQDYKMLKASVKLLYQRHCGDPVESAHIDEDVQKEYNRQREYLEKSVENLKRKLARDTDLHRYEATRFMQENASLIKEINDLRREIKMLKAQANRGQQQQPVNPKSRGSSAGTVGGREIDTRELDKEIAMQREEIKRLRERLAELEALTAVKGRPISRE